MIKLKEDGDRRFLEVKTNKKPKRITGTRLAGILNMDHWNSPFSIWCAITKTYEEPFVDNKYTLAGKAIEPKIVKFLKEEYLLNIETPEDVYGENHFRKTWGNFYPEEEILGGMWDGRLYEDNELTGILEIKTSSRPQDWTEGTPANYALQASLYAYLSGVEDVTMAVAFLQPNDYLFPEEYEPDSERIHVESFNIYEKYPDLNEKIQYALDWHKKHVETGISPYIETNKDNDILAILMTDNLIMDENTSDIERAYELYAEIEELKAKLNPLEKQYNNIKNEMKDKAILQMKDDKNTNKLEFTHDDLQWTVSKSERDSLDKDKLKESVDLNDYIIKKVTYTIRQKRLD